MDHHRAPLQVYDVIGMFRQAAVSFRASIPLFVTLALLSSVYETAVERSALLSGLSLSAQNSNFSFQFALDPKTQAAHSPHNAPNTGGQRKLDTADSLFARLLTAILPPDDGDVQSLGGLVQDDHNPVRTSEGEQVGGVNQGDMSSYMSEDHGNQLQEGHQLEKPFQGKHSIDTLGIEDTPDASSGLTTPSDNNNQPHEEVGEDVSRENLNADKQDTSYLEGGIQKKETLLGSEGDNFLTTDKEANPGSLNSRDLDLVHSNEEDEIDSIHSSEEGDVDSRFENTFSNDEDDADAISGLPRLKIETVSNETKKLVHETVIDAMDLTFFTGKLLGGRGLDQGAMPHGGTTMLLLFLLVTFAVAMFLALVGFQHAAVLGSVAYSVVCTHMGKRASARQALKSSLKSSIGRLMWLAILHATLRGLQSLFFMKTLFGGVMEMDQVEQLIFRLSATPFAFLAPFMDVDASSFGMAIRIALFVGFDYLLDGISYCIYVVACWVTIMERNYWGLGAVSRSFNLVKGMEWQAVVIRLIEASVCGRSARWLLQQVMGQFAAALVICLTQVYFLVLWFIFYMSARSFHDQTNFSHRTLEDFLDRFK